MKNNLTIILAFVLSGLCFLINFYAGLGFLAGELLAGTHAWFLDKQIDIFFKAKNNLHLILISYLMIYLILIALLYVFIKIKMPLFIGLAIGFFIIKIYFYIKKVGDLSQAKCC
jgi:hypothetical protein